MKRLWALAIGSLFVLACGGNYAAQQPEEFQPQEYRFDGGVRCYVVSAASKYGQAVSCIVVTR